MFLVYMSESFYLSIIGIGTAFMTGICLAGCKIIYRIKCVDFSCLGLICTRDIEGENEADENNHNGTDLIPPPISRRNSVI